MGSIRLPNPSVNATERKKAKEINNRGLQKKFNQGSVHYLNIASLCCHTNVLYGLYFLMYP